MVQYISVNRELLPRQKLVSRVNMFSKSIFKIILQTYIPENKELEIQTCWCYIGDSLCCIELYYMVYFGRMFPPYATPSRRKRSSVRKDNLCILDIDRWEWGMTLLNHEDVNVTSTPGEPRHLCNGGLPDTWAEHRFVDNWKKMSLDPG
jgi:hypothetical protein